ncbi:MAG: hypothetical protein CSA29_05650 [Desulfobacterales bacterium]|nr:MAG: hypothetical protein CSA29_05650 [Desulfobacterales bacterium]
MKKILIAIVLLIVISVPAVPFVNGIIMEKTFRGTFEQLNQLYTASSANIKFEIMTYDRGLFDSQILWRIKLGNMSEVYGIDDVVFTETARHGFTAITSETHLQKNVWYTDWINSKLGGKDPLTIQTRYSAFDPIVSTLSMDAFTAEMPDAPVTIGRLNLVFTVDTSLTSVSMNGTWDGMSQDNGNKMGPVAMTGDLTRISDLIWLGKGGAIVESFTTDSGNEKVVLSNLEFNYDISSEDDHKKMNMAMEMKTGDIVVNDQPLSDWGLSIALNNLDMAAYEEFIRLYYQVVNTQMAKALTPGIPQEDAVKAMQEVLAQNSPKLVAGIEKLLKKDLEFKISRLNIVLPQGEISGRLGLKLKQDVIMSQMMMLAAQPDKALEIFSMKTDVIVPVSLAGPRRTELTSPLFAGMKTGLFIQDGNILKHNAQTRDGKLYLNGKEVLLNF